MNLFELFVKIGADTTEANKGIDEVGQKKSGLGEKLKSGLATAGKVAVAGPLTLTMNSLWAVWKRFSRTAKIRLWIMQTTHIRPLACPQMNIWRR